MGFQASIHRLFLVIALVCVPFVGTPSSAATGRAVSLNALQSVLKAGGSKDTSRMCGMTRVLGYVADGRARDVIVVGEADSTLPPLCLDDFAVALRNASLLYVTGSGRVRYYAAPGCSIDPNPKMLRELQQLHAKQVDLSTPDKVKSYFDEWHTIGSQPQNVRVMGVPPNTHFAKVMVDADYYMKRLVNGSASLGIDGFGSLTDITLSALKEDIRRGRDLSVPQQSLSRFWFNPGEATYSEDDGVVMLKSCQVQLLTEEEFLTERGQVAGFGRPNPLAKQFAVNFTTHYASIASAQPIYKELEGLFRFAAVAKLIKNGNAHCAGLSYLLDVYGVGSVATERTLPGLTSVKEYSWTVGAPGNQRVRQMWLPSCGGVCMDIRPKRVSAAARLARVAAKAKSVGAGSSASTSAGTPASAPGLKKAILGARKSSNSLSWDFQLPPGK